MTREQPQQFIPESDSEFSTMACNFATLIAKNREKYFVSERDSEMITRSVDEFCKDLFISRSPRTRTKSTCLAKSTSRANAEHLIRKFGNFIRSHPHICANDKLVLGIKERATRLRERNCPQSVPVLEFVGSVDGIYSAIPVHMLRFREYDAQRFKDAQNFGRAKPAGAARVELFVGLLEPDEPVPDHPGELGPPWYLRSFTKNPMRVEFPMPTRPMQVVYWARWADAKCNVGPFSRTCAARIEGRPNAAALEDKSNRTRVVVSLRRRELTLVERVTERPLLECEAPIEAEPKALPDAA